MGLATLFALTAAYVYHDQKRRGISGNDLYIMRMSNCCHPRYFRARSKSCSLSIHKHEKTRQVTAFPVLPRDDVENEGGARLDSTPYEALVYIYIYVRPFTMFVACPFPGAIKAEESNVSISGTTTFTKNVALRSGGRARFRNRFLTLGFDIYNLSTSIVSTTPVGSKRPHNIQRGFSRHLQNGTSRIRTCVWPINSRHTCLKFSVCTCRQFALVHVFGWEREGLAW